MECYMDEEQIWKCPSHPSKRRRTGICPTCLRDRLNTLCPICAKLRPCDCFPGATATATSSTSSFSLFSSAATPGDGEPSMRRSRSLAIPFLRSRSKYAPNLEFVDQKQPLPEPQPPASDRKPPLPQPPAIASDVKPSTGSNRGKKSSLLSIFKSGKSKKLGEILEKEKEKEREESSNDFASMMKRSRSVSALFSSKSRAAEEKSAAKTRWHFPSPLYAFRQSKTSKVLEEQQQSGLCKV